MKRIYLAGAACIMAAASGTAHAQDADDGKGVYVELDAGIASVSDTDINYYDIGGTFGGSGSTDTAQGSVNVDQAVAFGGSIGYDFGLVRTDLEIGYSKNDIESLTIESVNGAAVTLDDDDADEICDYLEVDGCNLSGNTITYGGGGHVRQLSAMANVWLDIPVGGVVTPYVGGGLGVSGFETDGEGSAEFAWQLGAGVALNLSRSLSLTANYRHREVSGSTIEWDSASGFEVGNLKTDLFTAGIRLKM